MTTEADKTTETTQDTTTESKEVIEVNFDRLIKAVENLITGDRKRIKQVILYKANGDILFNISFAAGLTMIVLTTVLLPKLLALGIIGALLGGLKLEIVRREAEQAVDDEIGA